MMGGMMRIPGGDEALTEFLKKHPHLKVRAVTPMSSRDQASPAGRPAGVIETQPRAKPEKARSKIEQMMSDQIREAGLPKPIEWPSQHLPLAGRKYALDFAWPDFKPGIKLALEVDGAVHRIKGTFKSSFERGALLLIDGWLVLHVGGDEVRGGAAIYWLRRMFGEPE